jgi:hypothetical protein
MLNPHRICRFLFLFIILRLCASGGTFYVDVHGTTPAYPYSSWTTAATNIQDAIDAASGGDLVLVTNGTYLSGGRAMAGTLTNRVVLDKPLTVQSVNGPFVTTIYGAGATNGATAVRCAWLANNASLIGFTLTGGATATSGDTATLETGGAAWCASSNGLIANCIIVSNTAWSFAAGAYQGTLQSCLVITNTCSFGSGGGAVCNALLNDCTVVGNPGGGVMVASIGPLPPGVVLVTNCILYYNQPFNNAGGTYSYCCANPLPSGPGNFINPPQFVLDTLHLANSSPCRGAGTAPASNTDIFRRPWNNPPSLGCAEWQAAPWIFLRSRCYRPRAFHLLLDSEWHTLGERWPL